MAKKVLICENDVSVAAMLVNELAEERGGEKGEGERLYRVEIFSVYPSEQHDITEIIGKRVRRSHPDYVIVGKLADQYGKAIEEAEKARQGVICILYTDNENEVRHAKNELGYNAFIRPKELEDLFKFMRGHLNSSDL